MRRVWLRGSGNIRKRLLIHISAFNLSLLMRQLTGIGKPKSLQNRDMERIRRLLRPGGVVAPRRRQFQPVQGALAGQRGAVSPPRRRAPRDRLEGRIPAQVFVVVQVLMGEGEAVEAL